MSYLVKLVRDRIPAMLGGDGRVTYRRLSPEEHRERLRGKLVEEAVEYALRPSLEKLADVLEAVVSSAEVELGATAAQVEEAMLAKRLERGGLRVGVGMYVEHPADADAETPRWAGWSLERIRRAFFARRRKPEPPMECAGGAATKRERPRLHRALIAAGCPFGRDEGGDPRVPDMRGRVVTSAGGASRAAFDVAIPNYATAPLPTIDESLVIYQPPVRWA